MYVKNVTGVRRNGEYYVYGWRLRRPQINHYFPFATVTLVSAIRYPTSGPGFIIIYIYYGISFIIIMSRRIYNII